jgi:hypothetical protein
MKASELHKRVGKLRNDLQRSLNNIYIWASFSRNALNLARANEGFLIQNRFRVPSKIRNKEIERSADDLRQIAEKAVAQEIYFSVFVYAVAQVEAFINDLLFELLHFDPRRLKTRVKGIDQTSKIDVAELIDCSSRKEMIDTVIQRDLVSLFYARPSLQMEYLQAVTGVKLDGDIVAQWMEIKATRDTIVHNRGVSNAIYVRKAGALARAKAGDSLSMTDEYFEGSLALMKSLVGKITSPVQRDLKKIDV